MSRFKWLFEKWLSEASLSLDEDRELNALVDALLPRPENMYAVVVGGVEYQISVEGGVEVNV